MFIYWWYRMIRDLKENFLSKYWNWIVNQKQIQTEQITVTLSETYVCYVDDQMFHKTHI